MSFLNDGNLKIAIVISETISNEMKKSYSNCSVIFTLNLAEFDDGAVVVVVAEAIIDDDNEILLLASKVLADAAVVADISSNFSQFKVDNKYNNFNCRILSTS